jgi:hypothetical protein
MQMSNRVLVAIAIAGATSTCLPAYAQSAGGLHGGFGLRVSSESNVARAGTIIAAARGLEQSDTITSPSAKLDFSFPVAGQEAYLRGNVGYDFYQKNTQLNRERVGLDGGLTTRVGPCQGAVTFAYVRRIHELDDLTITNPKIVQEAGTIGASQTCGLSGGLGASFGVSRTENRNRGGIQQLDNQVSSLNGSLVYRRSSLGEARIFTNFSKTEYSNLSGFFRTPGYESKSVGLSYNRKFGNRISGSIQVSQNQVTPLGQTSVTNGNYSGLNYSGSLLYRATSRLDLNLSADRGIRPTLQSGGLFALSTQASVGATYKIGSKFTYSFSAREYQVSQRGILPLGQNILTNSRSVTESTGLTFQQNKRVSWTVDATHIDRSAGDPLFDYSDTRVGISANVNF